MGTRSTSEKPRAAPGKTTKARVSASTLRRLKNQRAVENLIRKRGPIRSSDITERLGLSRSATDAHINTLWAEGRIHIDHYEHAGQCRPSAFWVHGKGEDAPHPQKGGRKERQTEEAKRRIVEIAAALREKGPVRTHFIGGINPWTGAAA